MGVSAVEIERHNFNQKGTDVDNAQFIQSVLAKKVLDDKRPENAVSETREDDFQTFQRYFDANDNCIKEVMYMFGKTEPRVITERQYDENNNCISEVRAGGDGIIYSKKLYQYDGDKLIAEDYYEENNKLKSHNDYVNDTVEEFEYDENGNCKSSTITNSYGIDLMKKRYIDGKTIVEYDNRPYLNKPYDITPEDMTRIKELRVQGVSDALSIVKVKCANADKFGDAAISELIKTIETSGIAHELKGRELNRFCSALSEFLDKNPEINLTDFTNYIRDIDYTELFNIAPTLKSTGAKNMLSFYEYHYFKGNKDFDTQKLTLKDDFTDFLSNRYIGYEDMGKLLSVYPCTNRNIGSLPEGWCKNGNEAEVRKKLDALISQFQYHNTADRHALLPFFEERLQAILGPEAIVDELDKGSFGTGYKISVPGAKDVVLKLYHSEDVKSEEYNKEEHGQFVEVQRGIFLNNHSDAFVHFYMGRVGTEAAPDGYSITEFVDINVITKWQDRDLSNNKDYYIFAADVSDGHNIAEGQIFDNGQVHIIKREE